MTGGCNRASWKLQPGALEAATACTEGCSRMHALEAACWLGLGFGFGLGFTLTLTRARTSARWMCAKVGGLAMMASATKGSGEWVYGSTALTAGHCE